MEILQTERLVISTLDTTHAPFLLELLNTPGWLKYIGDRGVRNLADAEKYVLEGPVTSYRKHGFGLYLVALKPGDTLIGMCGFLKRDILDDPDIGFAFMPSFAGKGYAFEAAEAMMQYGREKLGFKRVLAITTQDNEQSKKLVSKLGLLFDRLIEWPDEKEQLMLYSTPSISTQ